MADPFNSLMTTNTANVLAGLGGMFANQQAHNRELADRQMTREQNMLQFNLQQSAMQDARRDRDWQVSRELRLGERQESARREESAFARLNASLGHQLKLSEIESRDRQLAFENTLKMQTHQLQTKMQTMQVEQVERAVAGQSLYGDFGKLQARFAAGEFNSDMNKYSEHALDLMEENQDGMTYLMSTPEGQKYINDLNHVISATKMISTRVPSLSPTMFGTELNWGDVQDKVREIDFRNNPELADDHRQSLGLLVDEAMRGITPEERAEIIDSADLKIQKSSKAEQDMYILGSIAEERGRGGEGDHWGVLAQQLRDPVGKSHIKELYTTGMLAPVRNKEQLERLQLIAQSQIQELGVLQKATGGRFLTGVEFEQYRDEWEDGTKRARLQVLTRDNPEGAWALEGAVGFGKLNEELMLQADYSRTWGDALGEWSGLYGAGRAIRHMARGGKFNAWDYADLASLTLLFIPGVGFAARKGVSAAMWLAGKTGAKVATKQAAKVTGRAALKAAHVKLAAAATKQRFIQRNLVQFTKAGDAARVAKWGPRAVEEAAKVRAARLGLAGTYYMGAGGVKGATHIAQRELRTRLSDDPSVTGGSALEKASRQVSDTIKSIQLMDTGRGPINPQVIDRLQQDLLEYRRTAAKYFDDGRIPPHLEEAILNPRNMVPPRVLREIQRRFRASQPGAAGQFNSYTDILRAQSMAPQQIGSPFGAVPAGGTGLDSMWTGSPQTQAE